MHPDIKKYQKLLASVPDDLDLIAGKCDEITLRVQARCPSLRRVYGHFRILARQIPHWFLITPPEDPFLIVDPTQHQFGLPRWTGKHPVGITDDNWIFGDSFQTLGSAAGRCQICGQLTYPMNLDYEQLCVGCFTNIQTLHPEAK